MNEQELRDAACTRIWDTFCSAEGFSEVVLQRDHLRLMIEELDRLREVEGVKGTVGKRLTYRPDSLG